MSALFIPKSSF